jgi:hypothetical protein
MTTFSSDIDSHIDGNFFKVFNFHAMQMCCNEMGSSVML